MVHAILDFLRTLTDPERLIQLLSGILAGWPGYALLFAIVFSETGLLVGFFLPGDSLLFTVGVVAGAGDLNIVIVNLVLMAAAMIGDTTGFWLGRITVPASSTGPNSAPLQAAAPGADAEVL
jgi:membrane-associated protein